MQLNDDDELIYDLGYVTALLQAPEVCNHVANDGAEVSEVFILDDTGPGLSDYIAARNLRIDQAIEALRKIFGN